ncbi:MAG TPA: PQQ-binding-like beta-propeller repeat protein [Verrucomicrobiae bacterium]
MKVQCSCGAKYEFEVTPEMAGRPVKFVCAVCGLNASEFVDGLVRQHLGQSSTPSGVPLAIRMSQQAPSVAASAPPLEIPPPPQPVRRAGPVRLTQPETVPVEDGAELDVGGTPCLKHPGQVATQKCFICSKPICPRCMQLFGYVCSPLCKAKADSHGIRIPVFEGQQSVREARVWRRVVWAGSSAGVIIALLLGFWFWYAWFGRLPKTVFSARFPAPSYSGHSAICGRNRDQIVFLHGTTLARYDMKHNQPIWSANLLDKAQIDAAVARQQQATQKLIDKANNEAWDTVPGMPSAEKLEEEMERDQAASLQLHVRGENVWVGSPGKLVRYDWDTGNVVKELAVQAAGFGGLIARGDEVMVVDREGLKPMVTRINLATAESRTEELGAPEAAAFAGNDTPAAASGDPGTSRKAGAGLPGGVPGRDLRKPMDPAKVAQEAQNLSYAAKLALPATLANTMNQERAFDAMDDGNSRVGLDSAGDAPRSRFLLVPAKNGFVQFAVKLVEQRLVARSAMKAPTGKSVLQGNVTAGKSLEAANELLNEMQRERGGDVVQEDLSRYEVTVRRPGVDQAWIGEVIGPPRLYPLETVTVIAANESVVVLDKDNRQLWQSPLTYNVRGEIEALDENEALYGQGPCVEHKGSLYVIDEGLLTAFDLATGKVRWRYLSVGIAGLFFDDRDCVYVNSTTASPDSIKFSRQIDINQKVTSVIAKLDPANGTPIWTGEPGGLINYVSGKYVYVVQSYTPDEEDSGNPYRVETGFEKGPFLRVKRLNPKNGHEIWEHFQQRAPVNIAIDKNTIRLMFKKEVQVLRSLEF